VPLDTALPQQRIDGILAISRPALLLTPEDIARLSISAARPPANGIQRDDPFYILFTSGSTGEPKGVIITLGCLEHFVTWMLEEQVAEAMLPRMRRLLFCGETLAVQTPALLLERFPRAQVWNMYGPTETTVATTSVRVDHSILEKYPALPVGRAMPGTDVFVVNEAGETLPANTRGEIVIAGPNVSPGYLGRPDLTAAAFFEPRHRRAYRTGDQGRFRYDILFFD